METPPPTGSADPPTEGRLDSWKEIAAYLNRDVRTVTRWEAEGLPVHRHQHHKQASVYAYRDEVAAWVENRQPRRAPTTRRAWWRRGGVAAAAAGVAGVGLLTALFWPTPVPPLEFAERDWVLITDFDNRTGEEVLDGTLKGALTRELSNSPFVNVVPPERVGDTLRLMRQPPDAVLDRERGLEVALRDGGIRAVLTGHVEKLDSTYLLATSIVDPTTGVTVASVSREAPGQRALVAALRQLSNEVRETLGEALSSIEVTDHQLERVTTPSFRALQLYSQAESLFKPFHELGRKAVAEALLRQAVAEDPGFATAYMALAKAIGSQRRPQEARPYAERAFELIDTTSDRERYFILGDYYAMSDRLEESLAAYETLVRQYPDHYRATSSLAGHYQQSGQDEQAVRYFIRMADLRPHDFESNLLAAHQVIQLAADPRLARPYAARARQLESAGEGPVPQDWSRHWLALFPVYERWLANDSSSALDALAPLADTVRRATGARPDELAMYVGWAYVMLGRLESAAEMFESMADQEQRAIGLAEIAWARGDLRAAREHAQHASRWYQALIPYGETSWALDFLADPPPQPPNTAMEQFVRGRLALAHGETTAAISLIEAGLKASPSRASVTVAEMLAQAWQQQGDLDRARRVLEDASRQRTQLLVGTAFSAVSWLRLEAERARLTRELGRDDEATQIEARLLQLLAFADADHAILREIKARQTAPQSATDPATPAAN